MIKAWHFLADDNGKPERHQHADPLSALEYARGPWVSMCELDCHGTGDNKPVARRRKHLWAYDATEVLRDFACQCAMSVINIWDPPDVVRRYLETRDSCIMAAARATAREEWEAREVAAWKAASLAPWATREVWSVFWAARAARAARAAYAACREGFPEMAAREAAWEASWAARKTWEKTWNKTRETQNALLEKLLLEGRG